MLLRHLKIAKSSHSDCKQDFWTDASSEHCSSGSSDTFNWQNGWLDGRWKRLLVGCNSSQWTVDPWIWKLFYKLIDVHCLERNKWYIFCFKAKIILRQLDTKYLFLVSKTYVDWLYLDRRIHLERKPSFAMTVALLTVEYDTGRFEF